MAKIELTDEFDVTEELVLALDLHISVVLSSVCLASILCLLLESLELLLNENLLEH